MSSETKHQVPEFGWKVKLDHKFPEKRDPYFVPSFKLFFQLFTLVVRYVLYQLWCYIRNRKPVMDYIKLVNAEQMYGVPLGGIGGGTIGRGFAGEFCRFQLKPGIYEYDVVDADQFIVTVRDMKNFTIYQSVLSPRSPPKSGHLSIWKWNFPGCQAKYTALYPRSWTEYLIPECNIKLICRQISPVIPHNYKDSSLPGGVLIWRIENNGSEPLRVTITMCLKGYKNASGAAPFEQGDDDMKIHGVKIENDVNSMKCTFAFGAKESEEVEVTSSTFNPQGTGASIWDQLYNHGGFKRRIRSSVKYFGEIACAVAAETLVLGNSSQTVEFALVWHMPFVYFHNRGKIHERYYTKYFGVDQTASEAICYYALTHYNEWEEAICEWQRPILNDSSLPAWYKSAIFNELYFISDGGTVWLRLTPNEYDALPATDARKEYGVFAYLEGHEYRMYNTYDVHFYASFALADLWPKLQQSVQYEICDAITYKDLKVRWFLFDGHIGHRKEANCVPHDVGDPGIKDFDLFKGFVMNCVLDIMSDLIVEEEPFVKINAYPVHDITDWKDLNLKFILQCYRDYVYMKDEDYLQNMWPSVKLLMNNCLKWDKDGDGMIENSGFPDQTYDSWTMSGVRSVEGTQLWEHRLMLVFMALLGVVLNSSYCGSLWLGALYVTVKMAVVMEDKESEEKFAEVLTRATGVFTNKLWNGHYYDFDSGSQNCKSIMADQLCGIWYLHASGIYDDILPKENVRQALTTIFENNVKRFKNGESGAVNGILPNGKIDVSSVQSQEVWTGVTYGVASHFIFHGMEKEGFTTAEGIYETVYNKIGLGFCTPEALYESKHYRSVGYMRALSIWSMQIALQKLKQVRM